MSCCRERVDTSARTGNQNRRQPDEESASSSLLPSSSRSTSSSPPRPRHFVASSAENTRIDSRSSSDGGAPLPQSNKQTTTAAATATTAAAAAAAGQNQKQGRRRRRPICPRCQRPAPAACICAALPAPRLALGRCRCWILQHPHERRRKNRSLPLVELCLDNNDDGDDDDDQTKSLTVVQGRCLYSENPHVQRLRRDAATGGTDVWLLSPGGGAISLKRALEERKLATASGAGDGKNKKLTLLFLDATWKYAQEMDRANTKRQLYPANLQRVQLTERDDLQPILRQHARRFAIRTPPSPCHLSTAECLAWVVAQVEEDPTLYDKLMKPLDLMVQKWRSFSNANKEQGSTAKEGNESVRSEQ